MPACTQRGGGEGEAYDLPGPTSHVGLWLDGWRWRGPTTSLILKPATARLWAEAAGMESICCYLQSIRPGITAGRGAASPRAQILSAAYRTTQNALIPQPRAATADPKQANTQRCAHTACYGQHPEALGVGADRLAPGGGHRTSPFAAWPCLSPKPRRNSPVSAAGIATCEATKPRTRTPTSSVHQNQRQLPTTAL